MILNYFKFLKKIMRALANFLFSFSSKLALHCLWKKAVADNEAGIGAGFKNGKIKHPCLVKYQSPIFKTCANLYVMCSPASRTINHISKHTINER